MKRISHLAAAAALVFQASLQAQTTMSGMPSPSSSNSIYQWFSESEDYPSLVPLYIGGNSLGNNLRGSGVNCLPTAVAMAISYEQAYCKSIIPTIEGASWPLAEYGNANSYDLVNEMNNLLITNYCTPTYQVLQGTRYSKAATFLQTKAPWFTHCSVSATDNQPTVEELALALKNHLGVCVGLIYTRLNTTTGFFEQSPGEAHALVLTSIYYNKEANHGVIGLIDTDNSLDPNTNTFGANTSDHQFYVQDGGIIMDPGVNRKYIMGVLYIDGRHSAQFGNNQPAGQASTNYISSFNDASQQVSRSYFP